MRFTILGSGGCMIIPKPLCRCRVCREARDKGIPYARGGPAALLHDANLLIDAPAEIAAQLNRERVGRLDYLMLTHLDPDHVEGLRVVEQIALDFRTWRAYPGKRLTLLLPEPLEEPLGRLRTQYGSAIGYYRDGGFLDVKVFAEKTRAGDVSVTAVPVELGERPVFVYVYEKGGRKIVYAPCDVRPFPEDRPEVRHADILVIQPGIFEDGLRHGFRYPPGHVSRGTLYTFEETLALAGRLGARRTVFVHLEEYWHRSYDDYRRIARKYPGVSFAWDGIRLEVPEK
jgi:phosphoribosyl 1,2-cyclic phosphate phosphodiesterase